LPHFTTVRASVNVAVLTCAQQQVCGMNAERTGIMVDVERRRTQAR
jgi:hypothetical protein